jgi:hypothetical protein
MDLESLVGFSMDLKSLVGSCMDLPKFVELDWFYLEKEDESCWNYERISNEMIMNIVAIRQI